MSEQKLRVRRRHHLREQKIKQILIKISKTVKLNISDIVDKRTRIEVVELIPKSEIIPIDNKAAFIQLEDEIFPILLNEAILAEFSSTTVDMGQSITFATVQT